MNNSVSLVYTTSSDIHIGLDSPSLLHWEPNYKLGGMSIRGRLTMHSPLEGGGGGGVTPVFTTVATETTPLDPVY